MDNKEPFEKEAVSKIAEAINWKKEIIEWAQAIVIAVVLALILRTYIFNLVKVDGNSMLPTLHHQDRLVVWRLGYKPKQGDIIIFRPEAHRDTPYVKRVIAVPGQTVDIDFNRNVVLVDGKELEENYINDLTRARGNVQFPITVKPNTVFVLGDNRNNSKDSRFSDVGLISYKSIMGKAVFRIWPFKDFGSVYKK